MRMIIVGGGKVGFSIAEQLTKEGHDIVVIDSDRRVSAVISDSLDVMSVCGSGASVEVLRQAGVSECDLLIASTGQDELNIMCCMFAKKLGCERTIARVRSPEYYEQIYLLRDELGLSLIVNPELKTAQEIFGLIEIPGVFKRDTFAEGRVEIVELVPKAGDALDGVMLRDLPKTIKCSLLVCAVQRGDSVLIPDGSFTLAAGDKVYVCAPAAEIVRVLRTLGLHRKRVRDVMLIGGSRVAVYLTTMLQKTGARVRIIEQAPEKADALAEKLPDAQIICADGTSASLLASENAEQMDTAVLLTNIDEENMILAMYLSRIGVPQVITKVNRTEFGIMLGGLGVDRVVSPKRLCANVIVRYVRAMQNTDGSSVIALHHLVDGRVDALEFSVTAATKNLGRTLREIQLKPNILISSINRRGKIIVPGGNDVLEEGDTVVVVTTSERVILDLNDIFAEEE
jgi:trk system potassium uptake protein TrkA